MTNVKTIAVRMKEARRFAQLSSEQASQSLCLEESTLLGWENGTDLPDLTLLPSISRLYGVTNDWLLTGQLPTAEIREVTTNLTNQIFDPQKMYTYIGAYANAKGFHQTMRALPFARDKHSGQLRKGRGGTPVPYIYHPLLVTCHALALGIYQDEFLAAALLHDVCEDCEVTLDELPVNDKARELVRLVTKPANFTKTPENEKLYYDGIASNGYACLIKLLDRCHNVSGMSGCFDDAHMASYIIETETYIMPLLNRVKLYLPEYDDQAFLIKYHMVSVLETIKHYMKFKL